MKTAVLGRGVEARDFSLMSDANLPVRLSDFRGTRVVLYFYPKDATPGCTVEAQEFRDAMPKFRKRGVTVLGISPDTVKSHCKFIKKEALNFRLLADIDHEVASKYGLWVEKLMYGRKFWGVQRATFLIGPDGKIERIWPKVTPKGHAQEVLDAVDELGSRPR